MRIGERRDGTEHIVHRWVPDPDVIHLVVKAFEMRAAGKTYKQINDMTHLYDNKSGYKRLFRNRLFLGELHHGDTVILDYCDPVIDQQTWDAVQRVSVGRNPYSDRNHPRRINSKFILSGIIFCGQCGSILNGHVIPDKLGRRYTYYRCKQKDQKWACDARLIPQDALEKAVLEEMKHIMTPENIATVQDEAHQIWQENSSKRESERARLNRRLSTVTRKMGNLIGVIGDTGNRRLLEELQELERREVDLISQLSRLDDGPAPVLDLDIEKLSAYIIKALEIDNEGINDLLRNLIHRIEVKRKGMTIRGTIYSYAPVDQYGGVHRSGRPHTQRLKVRL